MQKYTRNVRKRWETTPKPSVKKIIPDECLESESVSELLFSSFCIFEFLLGLFAGLEAGGTASDTLQFEQNNRRRRPRPFWKNHKKACSENGKSFARSSKEMCKTTRYKRYQIWFVIYNIESFKGKRLAGHLNKKKELYIFTPWPLRCCVKENSLRGNLFSHAEHVRRTVRGSTGSISMKKSDIKIKQKYTRRC